MILSFITGLVALAKAVPALTGFCEFLINFISKYDASNNEQIALDRKTAKDQSVDDAIFGVRNSSPLQQQRKIDEK